MFSGYFIHRFKKYSQKSIANFINNFRYKQLKHIYESSSQVLLDVYIIHQIKVKFEVKNSVFLYKTPFL
jgi:flagellar biosynthesis protein FliP